MDVRLSLFSLNGSCEPSDLQRIQSVSTAESIWDSPTTMSIRPVLPFSTGCEPLYRGDGILKEKIQMEVACRHIVM